MYQPSSLPPEAAAALDAVRSLASAVERATSPEERGAWLVGLRRIVDATEATFADALQRFDAHGDGETLHGARTTAAWLRGALRLAPGDAGERVRIARGAAAELEAAVADLREGAVTYDHVRAIERASRVVPVDSRQEAADLLTTLARQLDVAQLRAAGQALRHAVDPDGGAAEAQAQFERRFLHLSPLLDGMTAVDGLLDAEATAVVTSALAPFLVPTDACDSRSTAQRRADALVELARVAVAAGALPVLSGSAAHLDVVVPFERLVGETSAPPASVRLPVGGEAPLPDATVERLGCDATVARIVMGPGRVPLDLGRDQRLFSPAQRRALAVRDGGCRWPGCGRAARYTDAHHVVAWSRGGRSDLGNAVLLCRHHHRLAHEGGWRLAVVDPGAGSHGALDVTGPAGQRLHCPPRGP